MKPRRSIGLGLIKGGIIHEQPNKTRSFWSNLMHLGTGLDGNSNSSGVMEMTRTWAMPNSETFDVLPIGEFVNGYLDASNLSIDPFARNKRWATYTNDLNPNTKSEHHMECEDFLKMLIDKEVVADLIILDPPYSPRQTKECYDSIGIKMAQEDAWGSAVRKRRRKLINKIVGKNGVVLTFGWDTNGMGGAEWVIENIMLVAHGSDHNDTICMAERRVVEQEELF